MKTLLILIFAATVAHAQVNSKTLVVENGSIYMKSDKSLKDAFAMLRMMTPGEMFHYDMYIVKNGVTYYRPGLTLMRRNRAFLVKDGDLIKIRI